MSDAGYMIERWVILKNAGVVSTDREMLQLEAKLVGHVEEVLAELERLREENQSLMEDRAVWLSGRWKIVPITKEEKCSKSSSNNSTEDTSSE